MKKPSWESSYLSYAVTGKQNDFPSTRKLANCMGHDFFCTFGFPVSQNVKKHIHRKKNRDFLINLKESIFASMGITKLKI